MAQKLCFPHHISKLCYQFCLKIILSAISQNCGISHVSKLCFHHILKLCYQSCLKIILAVISQNYVISHNAELCYQSYLRQYALLCFYWVWCAIHIVTDKNSLTLVTSTASLKTSDLVTKKSNKTVWILVRWLPVIAAWSDNCFQPVTWKLVKIHAYNWTAVG